MACGSHWWYFWVLSCPEPESLISVFSRLFQIFLAYGCFSTCSCRSAEQKQNEWRNVFQKKDKEGDAEWIVSIPSCSTCSVDREGKGLIFIILSGVYLGSQPGTREHSLRIALSSHWPSLVFVSGQLSWACVGKKCHERVPRSGCWEGSSRSHCFQIHWVTLK